jgi:carbamoyl-phosphate synthase large subunit
MNSVKRNILVTAVGGRSVGSGILHSLVRSSKDVASRWNVIAADADPFSWGLYKVDQSVILPLASDASYIDEVKHIVVKNNIDAIIPGSEAEASVLANNKGLFEVPIVTNKAGLMPLMMDKFAAAEKISELGLPTIKTYPVENWKNAISEFGFPLIVKPTKGTGGSKGVSLCCSQGELDTVLGNLPEDSGYCIQPVIGDGEDEYTVGVLSDKDGNLIDSIVMRRKLIGLSLLDSKRLNNVDYKISTGYSQGYFVRNKMVQDFCEYLSHAIGSAGPLNLQLRIHNNKVYVFEIHPRFSGTSTMRADVGFNEPDVLLRNHLFNEKFSRLNYRSEVAVIRAFEHVVVPIDKMLKR